MAAPVLLRPQPAPRPTAGGVRLPSEFGIPTAPPPSLTATQLLVVPRSTPMTLGIDGALPRSVLPQCSRRPEISRWSGRGQIQACPPPSEFAAGGGSAGVRGLDTTTAAGRASRSLSL